MGEGKIYWPLICLEGMPRKSIINLKNLKICWRNSSIISAWFDLKSLKSLSLGILNLLLSSWWELDFTLSKVNLQQTSTAEILCSGLSKTKIMDALCENFQAYFYQNIKLHKIKLKCYEDFYKMLNYIKL